MKRMRGRGRVWKAWRSLRSLQNEGKNEGKQRGKKWKETKEIEEKWNS